MRVEKNPRKWLWVAVPVVAIIIAVILIFGSGNHTKDNPDVTDVIGQTEQPELVRVKMRRYQFTFNKQWEESVVYREVADTDGPNLEFYTSINDQEFLIFTLVFDSVEGDFVHMITDRKDEKTPIAFQMSVLPEGIGDEFASAFYMAQDVVNEVVASIEMR